MFENNLERLNTEISNQYFINTADSEEIIKEEIQIGDVVCLKRTNQVVTIQQIGYPITEELSYDYAGYDESTEQLLLFDQTDIKEIIKKKEGSKRR